MFFYGPSQIFVTTFNTPPSAYNLPPSTSYYRPSLPTQMHDIGHENEEDDDDGDDDDDNGGDHVLQQQHTIIREHPRTRGGRDRRPIGQQT